MPNPSRCPPSPAPRPSFRPPRGASFGVRFLKNSGRPRVRAGFKERASGEGTGMTRRSRLREAGRFTLSLPPARPMHTHTHTQRHTDTLAGYGPTQQTEKKKLNCELKMRKDALENTDFSARLNTRSAGNHRLRAISSLQTNSLQVFVTSRKSYSGIPTGSEETKRTKNFCTNSF